MSDYLGNLAARSLNLAGVLRPRLASIFEPLPAFGKRIEEYLADDMPVQSQHSNAVPGRADAVTRKQESRSEQPEPEGQKTTNFNTLHNPGTSTPQFLQADPGRYALRDQISSDRNILPGSIVPADKMVRGATVKRFPISGDGHPFANDRQRRHPGPKHNASSLDDSRTGEVSSECIIQENYSHESGNSEINRASKTTNARSGELQPKAAHLQINERSGERLNRLEPKVPIPPAEIKLQSANPSIQDQLSLRAATTPNDAGQNENPVDRLRSEAGDEQSPFDQASKAANAWPGELQPKAAHIQINEHSGEHLNRLKPKVPIPPAEIKPQSANPPIQDQLSLRAATTPTDAGQNQNPVDRLRSEAGDEHSELDQASKAANAWPGELQPKAAQIQINERSGERSNRLEPEIPTPLGEMKPESVNLPIQDQLSLRAATAPTDARQNKDPVDRLRSEVVDEPAPFDEASKAANAWPGELLPKAAHIQINVHSGERLNPLDPEAPKPQAEMKPQSVNLPIQDQPSLKTVKVPIDAEQNEIPVDRLRSEAGDEQSPFDQVSKANALAGELQPKAAHLQINERSGKRLNPLEPEAPKPLAEMKPQSANPPIQDQPSLRTANVPTDARQNEDPVDRLRSEASDEQSPFDQVSKANALAGELQPKAAHIQINERSGERLNRLELEAPMPLAEMKPQSVNILIQDQPSLKTVKVPNDAEQNENPVDRLRSEAGDEHFESDQDSEAANAWPGELQPKAAHIQINVHRGERSNRLEPEIPMPLAEMKPQSANPSIQDKLSLRAATTPNDAEQNEIPVDRLRSEAGDEHSELHQASKAAKAWPGELQPKAAHLQINVRSGERLNRPEHEVPIPPAEMKPESVNLPIQDHPSLRTANVPTDADQNEIPVDRLRSEASDEQSPFDPASKAANAWPGELQPRAAHLQFAIHRGERSNRLEPEAPMPLVEMKPESVNLPIQDQPSLRTAKVPTDADQNKIPVELLRSEAVDEHFEFDQASKANALAREPQPKADHLQFAVRPWKHLNRLEPEAPMPLVEMKPQSVNLPIQDQPSLRAATAPTDARQNEDPVELLRSEAVDEHFEFDQASEAANAWAREHPPRQPKILLSRDLPLDQPEDKISISLTEDLRGGSDDNSRAKYSSGKPRENVFGFVRDKATLKRSGNPAEGVHAYDRAKNNLIPEKLHAASRLAARPLRGPSSERKAEDSRKEKSEPSISVTIGRIEVRAVSALEKPVEKSSPKVQILSLDDYLRLRNGGQR